MEHISIPNTLREHRKKAGLRQMDVARKLGLTSAERISEWEKGLTFPHMTNLWKLAVVYDVFPHELYGELLKNMKNQMIGEENVVRFYNG